VANDWRPGLRVEEAADHAYYHAPDELGYGRMGLALKAAVEASGGALGPKALTPREAARMHEGIHGGTCRSYLGWGCDCGWESGRQKLKTLAASSVQGEG
jgi:hypothetical protein